MNSIADDYAAGLWSAPARPCLSLYQPTHARHPENQQDPIRFRNLLKTLERSLRETHTEDEAGALLAPFQALADDAAFWNHTRDGLAVLGAPGLFRVYGLPRAVPELAIVADSFHTKPLMRVLQSAGRYQVLALDRHSVRLFEGGRDGLDEVELAESVPRTRAEALAALSDEPDARETERSKNDRMEADTERFFRAVDRAVLERHSRPTGLPLVLAALPEHHAHFHGVSHNPFLVDEGVTGDPGALSRDALSSRAWSVIEPGYRNRMGGLVEDFGTAKANGLGGDDLREVAGAAAAGRVASLMVEADRQIPGRIEDATGRVQFDDLARPDADDLLDDLGELVLEKGGQVVVVAAEQMPSATGLAAIYRF